MKLYLTRHGDAMAAPIDAERCLSELGLQQAEHLAEHLLKLSVQPVVIYHSGLVRAQQTAAIISQRLGEPTPEKISGLRPSDSPEAMLSEIETWSQDTLLVGHLPFMGILLDLLVSSAQAMVFHPTSTVCLVGTGKHWQVEWVYTART